MYVANFSFVHSMSVPLIRRQIAARQPYNQRDVMSLGAGGVERGLSVCNHSPGFAGSFGDMAAWLTAKQPACFSASQSANLYSSPDAGRAELLSNQAMNLGVIFSLKSIV